MGAKILEVIISLSIFNKGLYMSVARIYSIAILLMLPIISNAEGGGDRVIERHEKMRDAQLAERAKSMGEDKESVAEQNTQGEETDG
ncbi:co-regulatory protein PtrA N-terminal domain-containing protein [Pseudomonas fluorescens]|uniref:co-regulatory protein PtrA N-terminal domain-containing protein n=1 Tax=Pseudomonas fluorescens TaxID=294 RepID=UPI001BECC863|nr:co-regulatory protein PtrA N-terminal domain-containing protein [Pseudomonas fluorescens]MBT2372344.1 hypothetical protein [Pseudomonas fluorescens]